jgi:ABC-type Fe3+-hydroxamate transport system substrate-binding protein
MPRFPATTLPALLSLGCATHQLDATAIAAAGSQLEGAPAPGERFEARLTDIDGQVLDVPDPEGRVVVLELIRSADW